eukprot:8242187-Lingulodinium_polyedra.AAC.2
MLHQHVKFCFRDGVQRVPSGFFQMDPRCNVPIRVGGLRDPGRWSHRVHGYVSFKLFAFRLGRGLFHLRRWCRHTHRRLELLEPIFLKMHVLGVEVIKVEYVRALQFGIAEERLRADKGGAGEN